MFKGHQAAEEIGMSAARLSYIIRYGLVPFSDSRYEWPSCIILPLKFVIGFDDRENKAAYSKKMSVHVIYYDETTKRVKRVYLGSQFMG